MDLFSVIVLAALLCAAAFVSGWWIGGLPQGDDGAVALARDTDLNRRADALAEREREARAQQTVFVSWEQRLNDMQVKLHNRTIALNKREHELNLREAEMAFGDADEFAKLPLDEKIRRVNQIEVNRLAQKRDAIDARVERALNRGRETLDREIAQRRQAERAANRVRFDDGTLATNQLATNMALGAIVGGVIGGEAARTYDLNPAPEARSDGNSSASE